MTDDTNEPHLDHAQAAEAFLRRAVEDAASRKIPARDLIALADHMARTALRLRALENSSPEKELPLVQYDQGHAGGVRDQMTFHINVGAAKASLSRLIAHALTGDNVVICRDGAPVARLVPFERALPTRTRTGAPDPLCPPDDREWFKPFAADYEEEE